MHTIFSSRTVQKALTGSLSSPLAALVQSYVSAGHWRKLVVCFADKYVYYHEPYGGQLGSRHAIRQAFEDTLAALDDGWRFQCIPMQFQTDGSSCGVWDSVTDRAFIAYVDSPLFGMGSFGSFLRSWLEGQGVTDLFAVRSSGAQRKPAIAANLAFIQQERRHLRERLAAAARDAKLSYTRTAPCSATLSLIRARRP